jgi:4-amino-4-deoxy-L-arabinose transferase-like glycosyltransferase
VLLAAGAMALWGLLARQWRAALRLAHPLAITAFCVVALPWYVACALRNPDFLRVFILQHNFERYLTPLYQHRQPAWFFLPILLLALLPWTVLLGPLAQEGRRLWREKTWRDSPGFFFACWAIFPVIFFSLSQSKLPGYVLPSIPPLSLLCAVAATRAMKATQHGGRMVAQGLGLTWFIVGLVALSRAHRISMVASDSSTLHASIVTGGVIASLIGAFMAGVLAGRKKHLAVPLCLLFVAAGVEFLNVAVLPSLDSAYSARPYAELLSRDLRPERIFMYDVPRSWDWGLAFYFRRELPEWSPADPEPALALTTEAGFAQIKKLGRFHGELDEPNGGIRLVPVEAAPH